MVKVEGLTQEEIAQIEKQSKLVRITTVFISDERVSEKDGLIYVKYRSKRVHGFPIITNINLNRVSVESPEYFGEAMELARAYESEVSEEFIVKKLYEK